MGMEFFDFEYQIPHFYGPQRSCGQGYVFTRVCDSVHRGGISGQTPPQDQADHPPPQQGDPPRVADCSIRSMSDRYASYWNAFLFLHYFQLMGYQFVSDTKSFVSFELNSFIMLCIYRENVKGIDVVNIYLMSIQFCFGKKKVFFNFSFVFVYTVRDVVLSQRLRKQTVTDANNTTNLFCRKTSRQTETCLSCLVRETH